MDVGDKTAVPGTSPSCEVASFDPFFCTLYIVLITIKKGRQINPKHGCIVKKSYCVLAKNLSDSEANLCSTQTNQQRHFLIIIKLETHRNYVLAVHPKLSMHTSMHTHT